MDYYAIVENQPSTILLVTVFHQFKGSYNITNGQTNQRSWRLKCLTEQRGKTLLEHYNWWRVMQTFDLPDLTSLKIHHHQYRLVSFDKMLLGGKKIWKKSPSCFFLFARSSWTGPASGTFCGHKEQGSERFSNGLTQSSTYCHLLLVARKQYWGSFSTEPIKSVK